MSAERVVPPPALEPRPPLALVSTAVVCHREGCFTPAGVKIDDVPWCVPCRREANGGRIL